LAAEELVAQLRHDRDTNIPTERHFRISIHQTDLSSTDNCVKLCEEVTKTHGRQVDILVSNAGYGKRIPDILWVLLILVLEISSR
jgi:3-oxoacyl-[acyl-carrier protein] reductase